MINTSKGRRDRFAISIRRQQLQKKFLVKRLKGLSFNEIQKVENEEVKKIVLIQKKLAKLSKEFSLLEIKDSEEGDNINLLKSIVDCLIELNQCSVDEFEKSLKESVNLNFVTNLNIILDEEKGEIVRLAAWIGGIVCVSENSEILGMFKTAKSGRSITNALKRDDSPKEEVEVFTKCLYFLNNVIFDDDDLKAALNNTEWEHIDKIIQARIKVKSCKQDILSFISNFSECSKIEQIEFDFIYLQFALGSFKCREKESIADSLRFISNFLDFNRIHQSKIDKAVKFLLMSEFYSELVLLLNEDNYLLSAPVLECLTQSAFCEDDSTIEELVATKGLVQKLAEMLYDWDKYSSLVLPELLLLYSNLFACGHGVANVLGSDDKVLDLFFDILAENKNSSPVAHRCMLCISNIFQNMNDSLIVSYLEAEDRISGVFDVLSSHLSDCLEEANNKSKMSGRALEFINNILSIVTILILDCETIRSETYPKSQPYHLYYCNSSVFLDSVDDVRNKIGDIEADEEEEEDTLANVKKLLKTINDVEEEN